jgi:hypothetical protein
VKSASIKSYDSARERLSARDTSGSSTTKVKPPPPPPRRAPSSSKQASGGPNRGVVDVERIDWASLSDEDKQAFFAWLDEFFARYLGLPQPATVTAPRIASAPVSAETSSSNTSVPSLHSSPSLPPRRVSSRASQNTGPDPPDEAAPAQAASVPGRRNLPPSLSQKGPVCLCFWNRSFLLSLRSPQPKINYSTKPSALTEEPAPLPSNTSSPSHPSSFPRSSIVLSSHVQPRS